jgi:hypothetical protein
MEVKLQRLKCYCESQSFAARERRTHHPKNVEKPRACSCQVHAQPTF